MTFKPGHKSVSGYEESFPSKCRRSKFNWKKGEAKHNFYHALYISQNGKKSRMKLAIKAEIRKVLKMDKNFYGSGIMDFSYILLGEKDVKLLKGIEEIPQSFLSPLVKNVFDTELVFCPGF